MVQQSKFGILSSVSSFSHKRKPIYYILGIGSILGVYSFCLFRKYVRVCVCKLVFRKIFVALFSGIVRPTKLKLATHLDNGWMYHVY